VRGARADCEPAVPRAVLAVVDPLQVRPAGVVRAVLLRAHPGRRRGAAGAAAPLLAAPTAGPGHDERGRIQHLRLGRDERAQQRLALHLAQHDQGPVRSQRQHLGQDRAVRPQAVSSNHFLIVKFIKHTFFVCVRIRVRTGFRVNLRDKACSILTKVVTGLNNNVVYSCLCQYKHVSKMLIYQLFFKMVKMLCHC
jgi:hypothetical protein